MRKYIRKLQARWNKKRPHPRQAVFNGNRFAGYRAKFDHDDRNTIRERTIDDRGQVYARMRNGQIVLTREVASTEAVMRIRAERRKARADRPKKATLAAQMFKNVWGKLFKKKARR